MSISKDSAEAREYHESQAGEILEELRRGPIYKLHWEQTKFGARLAAGIHCLRRDGYLINGHGIFKKDKKDPYVLVAENTDTEKLTNKLYDAYLSQPYWRGTRLERMRLDGHCCVQCKDTENLQVHHWVYSLYSESINNLCTYCEECHSRIHGIVRMAKPGFVHRDVYARIMAGQ